MNAAPIEARRAETTKIGSVHESGKSRPKAMKTISTTFWLGADTPQPPIRIQECPTRICRACGRTVCLTAQRMFCGCQTVPWEIQEDEE
jgi:hypothetical protein